MEMKEEIHVSDYQNLGTQDGITKMEGVGNIQMSEILDELNPAISVKL